MATWYQVLLIVVVGALLVMMVAACARPVTSQLNMERLKEYLLALEAKFRAFSSIDPDTERIVLEKLQNLLKTSVSQEAISGNAHLQALFYSNCKYIEGRLAEKIPGKTSWLKFQMAINDFDELYFSKTR